LTTRGLGAALEDLCDRAPIPVQLDLSLNGPCPSEVEAAAYFVSEALTNAAKHSCANRVDVAASCDDGSLVIAVVDNGRGGASPQAGTGLRGLTDRVEALGGALVVSSLAERGTTLHAEMPCA
jgi:signal transduction histidine kinase